MSAVNNNTTLLGTYSIKDIEDRAILLSHNRIFEFMHEKPDWKIGDTVQIFRDIFADKGQYLLKDTEGKASTYITPMGPIRPELPSQDEIEHLIEIVRSYKIKIISTISTDPNDPTAKKYTRITALGPNIRESFTTELPYRWRWAKNDVLWLTERYNGQLELYNPMKGRALKKHHTGIWKA